MKQSVLIGLLRPNSFLKIKQGYVRLLDSREPNKLVKIDDKQIGRFAVVKGFVEENNFYLTGTLEVLSPVASNLIENFLKKEILSWDEIQNEIENICSDQIVYNKLCALVIGHKKHSPGAVNKRKNLSEFDFNEDLAIRIERRVKKVKVQRIYRRTFESLPHDINLLDPDFIVSLHCNAFNGKASGTEVLYYHRSEKGKKMAEILLRHLVEYLKLPNRGIKPKTAEDRGGYLLRYTKAPCVIAEPFFIDNDDDLARAQEDIDGLALAYARAIEEIAKVV